jgi:hypothetical protein
MRSDGQIISSKRSDSQATAGAGSAAAAVSVGAAAPPFVVVVAGSSAFFSSGFLDFLKRPLSLALRSLMVFGAVARQKRSVQIHTDSRKKTGSDERVGWARE